MTKEYIDDIAKHDALWIVRSAGERTAALCAHLIAGYFNPYHLITITERPFTAAVEKSFSLGAESDVKWTICIDADVLLEKNGIAELLAFAEKTEDHIFCIQGQIYDKLIPIKRAAGNHMYRNSLLHKALKVIPKDITLKRPESETTRAMKALGYSTYQTNILVGLHDFEQYYSDIFRKCFTHVNKHEKSLVPLINNYWNEHKKRDQDFFAAWLGGLAGKAYEGDLIIDLNFKKETAKKLLAFAKLVEKDSLDVHSFTNTSILQLMNTYKSDPVMLALKNPRVNEIYIKDEPDQIKNHTSYKVLRHSYNRMVGKAFLTFGRILVHLSKKLRLS